MPDLTTGQLAAICGGALQGDPERRITGANTLDAATAVDLAFADNGKAFDAAERSRAGCLVAPTEFDRAGPWSIIRSQSPRAAFARAVSAIYEQPPPPAGIHSTAIVHSSAAISPDAHVGAYVTIGAGAVIAAKCCLAAGCRIAEGVEIGEGSTLHPNVAVYPRVRIGRRVVVHSGCVIGADGFGYTLAGDHYEKFPQVGTVDIGDDVELGPNCCIDRAALGVTRIGAGTKLDNLVHVAHNCTLGKHIVIAAQTGLSGSVTIGDYAAIGGQAGIGEKAFIEAKSIVGGKAGVLTGQRIRAGEPVWGIPARPLRQHLKNLAHVARLGELFGRVKNLERANTIDE